MTDDLPADPFADPVPRRGRTPRERPTKRRTPGWVWALAGIGVLAPLVCCAGMLLTSFDAARKARARLDAQAAGAPVAVGSDVGTDGERLDRLGRAVAEALNAGDPAAAGRLLDADAVARRALRGLAHDPALGREIAAAVREGGGWPLNDLAEIAGAPGRSARHVGRTTYLGEPAAVVRVRGGGLRYAYVLPTDDGRVADAFDFGAGIGAAGYQRLYQTKPEVVGAAQRVLAAAGAGDPRGALTMWKNLPAAERDHRYVQVSRLYAAERAGRGEFRDAVADLEGRFVGHAEFALMRYEAASGPAENVAALEDLAALTARDPHVLALLAEWLPDLGRTDEATEFAAEALAAEPDDPQSHRGVLAAAIGRGDHPAAVAALRTLRDRFGAATPPGDLYDFYPAANLLLASPEYRAFAAENGDPGGEAIGGAATLTDARSGFETNLGPPEPPGEPPPEPPPWVPFDLVTYPAPGGDLAAYLTRDLGDGPGAESPRRPAIVWVTGGDCNSIGPVWDPGPPSNDQTAAAYREAGIVTLFPSLRGGNANPGRREGFLGEADDLLAAADFLVSQPHVDPNRIYLGGHSTGGTLAAVTAELTGRFRATFAFGPVFDVRGYGGRYLHHEPPGSWPEAAVRSPGYWLADVTAPLFLIEGAGGNAAALRDLREANANPLVRCLEVPGADHFDVLAPANAAIAAAILADDGPECRIKLTPADLTARP